MARSTYEALYKVLMNINESGCLPYGMASALIVIGVSAWYPDKTELPSCCICSWWEKRSNRKRFRWRDRTKLTEAMIFTSSSSRRDSKVLLLLKVGNYKCESLALRRLHVPSLSSSPSPFPSQSPLKFNSLIHTMRLRQIATLCLGMLRQMQRMGIEPILWVCVKLQTKIASITAPSVTKNKTGFGL